METLGADMFTNMGSTDHVTWDAVDSMAGSGREGTHQGLKVLAVTAGIGRGKGPQDRVALVALQGRSEETAPEVGCQRVAPHCLPDRSPACRLHRGSQRVARGDAAIPGLGLSLRSAVCGQRGTGPGDKGLEGTWVPSLGVELGKGMR